MSIPQNEETGIVLRRQTFQRRHAETARHKRLDGSTVGALYCFGIYNGERDFFPFFSAFRAPRSLTLLRLPYFARLAVIRVCTSVHVYIRICTCVFAAVIRVTDRSCRSTSCHLYISGTVAALRVSHISLCSGAQKFPR